ncbi:RN213-like protein [Mya arenaria]|uniref:RN213-like protein n=1 Tax=Mya arenaria TaxID=6604 RepID=A0ABY7ENI9_MYAAR|nr:RN213-like protein [Mya arenaria]
MYIQMRTVILHALRTGKVDAGADIFKDMQGTAQQLCFLLSFCKAAFVDIDEEENEQKLEAREILYKLIPEGSPLTQQVQLTLGKDLSWCNLTVQNCNNTKTKGIGLLLIHYVAVMKCFEANGTILQPLQVLMFDPKNGRDMILPTMQEYNTDELETILNAMKAAGDYGASLYLCPNNHPFIVGNCGNAVTAEGGVKACHICKAPIGGEDYAKPLEGNLRLKSAADISKGHNLGKPETRNPITTVRNLRPPNVAIVRLLTHMSMFNSSSDEEKLQELGLMVKTAIEPTKLGEFFWNHMEKDLNDLSNTLGITFDDALLLMHFVVQHIFGNIDKDLKTKPTVCNLTTNEDRAEWETEFSERFLQDILKDLDRRLQEINNKLTDDTELGRLIYEQEMEIKSEQRELQDEALVWRYRMPVTFQHMRQSFESTYGSQARRDELIVLENFVREDDILKALQYIPNIMKMQRVLISKYQRRIDKLEAREITVKQVIAVCVTELGRAAVKSSLCDTPITEDTCLLVLLPTTKEEGLCSYAMLDFLFRQQNNFLDEYLKTCGRKINSIPTVSAMDVTSAHLISYDHAQDILPLIHGNSQYTFKMGEGTNIEYDFEGIQRQLIDRFLFPKSKVDIHVGYKMQVMVYRSEVTDVEMFMILDRKIPQEKLNNAQKVQICEDLKNYPDVCTSIENLDIAIGFLKTAGGTPRSSLDEFMSKTLRMTRPMVSKKAQQMCEFQHCKALWLVLMLHKAKLVKDNFAENQTSFETISEDFQESLPENCQSDLNTFLKPLSVDKVGVFVEVLHEFILLHVGKRENIDDENYVETTHRAFREEFYAFLDDADDTRLDPNTIVTEFPESIRLKHCTSTWDTAYFVLKEKRGIV